MPEHDQLPTTCSLTLGWPAWVLRMCQVAARLAPAWVREGVTSEAELTHAPVTWYASCSQGSWV